jgi:hypothetical protein
VSGYFKVHRSLLEHPYWCRGEFTKGQAVVDLVGHARWKEGFADIAGRRIPLKKGDLCWSIKQLAGRWGWSYNKVRRFLNELKADNFLDYQNYTVTTVISITNFAQYQNGESPDERPDERPDESQKKKVKKERSNKYSAFFENFWKLYPARGGVKSGKAQAWKAWQKLGNDTHYDSVMQGLKVQMKSEQWTKDDGQFIPMASTFLNQKRWEVEIVPRGTSSGIDQLVGEAKQILRQLIADSDPSLMSNLDAYCLGTKPIPPDLRSLMQEEIKERKKC